ncbi:MAG: hypothetical protein L3J52_10255, partial [Proteobacteria bacterium]|nr:hypothetical protein [Pseudomonadota bacterium]
MFKTKLSQWVVLLPLFLLLAGILVRAVHMSRSMQHRLDCFACVMKYVVLADFLILALLLFAFSFSVARNVYLRLTAKIFSLLIVIFYFLDIAIQQNFNRRLFFTDLSVYAIDLGPIWSHLLVISDHEWQLYVTFFLVFLLMGAYLWLKPVFSRSTSIISVLLALVLLLIYSVREKPVFISSWALENYLQSNVNTMESTLYSEKTVLKVAKFNTPSAQCS